QPLSQAAGDATCLAIRTSATDLAATLEREASSLNGAVAIYDVTTMDRTVFDFLQHPRFRAAMLGGLAALAMALAAVGIYGVLSQSVVQRTQEIGVRVALGARNRDDLRLGVGQGMLRPATGMGAGLGASLGLTRLISALLYGVKATDPSVSLLNTVLIAGVALAACYFPARRAMRIEPMAA